MRILENPKIVILLIYIFEPRRVFARISNENKTIVIKMHNIPYILYVITHIVLIVIILHLKNQLMKKIVHTLCDTNCGHFNPHGERNLDGSTTLVTKFFSSYKHRQQWSVGRKNVGRKSEVDHFSTAVFT